MYWRSIWIEWTSDSKRGGDFLSRKYQQSLYTVDRRRATRWPISDDRRPRMEWWWRFLSCLECIESRFGVNRHLIRREETISDRISTSSPYPRWIDAELRWIRDGRFLCDQRLRISYDGGSCRVWRCTVNIKTRSQGVVCAQKGRGRF